jgi:hypothetical protein
MPTCTIASLVETFPQFQFPTLSDHQKMALLVYLNAIELQAVGGTNYISSLTTTLITDSKIFNNLSNDQLGVGIVGEPFTGVATLAIAYNNATNAGGAPPTNQNAVAAAIHELVHATSRELAQAYLLLQCKLGRHTGS